MATTRDAGSPDGEGPATPITVVHVDDDSEFLSTTVSFLGSRYDDITVEAFTRPAAVIERLEVDEGAVDCVVSDYAMPEMDGLELLAAVRSAWPDLPFVLYTGRGNEEVASDAISQGVSEYVQKGSGTSHYDLLVNRIRNAVVTARTAARADELEHVASTIRKINQALLRADTEERLFADAVETLADAEPYVAASIVTTTAGVEALQQRASAGSIDAVAVFESSTGCSVVGDLIHEAFVTRTLQVRQRLVPDPIDLGGTPVLGEDYRSLAAAPLIADGSVFGVLVLYGRDPVAFDVAERDLVEEIAGDIGFAVHAMDLRDRLANRAAELELLTHVLRHDVRNDVQVVQGWCTLLADSASADQREYVEKIATTARHIVDLTDNARDVVEALVADDETALEPVAVGPVLEAELDKARNAYEHATFSLSGDLDDRLVLGNELLASVFRNVLNNAVLHSDRESPRVEVTADDREEWVVVRIADDGPGFPTGRREQVLAKGERGLDSSGTGMGLFLVDTLVAMYGGRVGIEDNDPGAVVVIELPTV